MFMSGNACADIFLYFIHQENHTRRRLPEYLFLLVFIQKLIPVKIADLMWNASTNNFVFQKLSLSHDKIQVKKTAVLKFKKHDYFP